LRIQAKAKRDIEFTKMSEPKNHHWVPQFHLKKWANETGDVPTWGRVGPEKKVHKRYKSTAKICSAKNLYSLKMTSPEDAQIIEKDFLRIFDNNAAKITNKIIRKPNLPFDERQFFAKYLLNLHIRNPYVIQKMEYLIENESHVINISQKELEEIGINISDEEREILKHNMKNDIPRRIIIRFQESKKILKTMLNLNWCIFDISLVTDPIPLIISDTPLYIMNGLEKSDTEVFCPLSQHLLFWASRRKVNIEEKFNLREMSKISNRLQVSAASKFVFGETNHAFVDKYLRR